MEPMEDEENVCQDPAEESKLSADILEEEKPQMEEFFDTPDVVDGDEKMAGDDNVKQEDVKEEGDGSTDIQASLSPPVVEDNSSVEDEDMEDMETIEVPKDEPHDITEETEAVDAAETEDAMEFMESDTDSQTAPTLSSVEPPGSVESNVASVEMMPPVLSPNYVSEELSEENEAKTDTEEEEESNREDSESTADSDVNQESQEPAEEEDSGVNDQPEETHVLSNHCDKVETALGGTIIVSHSASDVPSIHIPELPSPPPPSICTDTLPSFQLPTVPLSLQETQLHSQSPSQLISSDPSSSPASSQIQPPNFVSFERLLSCC